MKRPFYITLAFGLMMACAAQAADYPARAVQVVVPYNAGGGTDLSARLMAQTIEKYLDGTMIVRNQPGGGGAIGTSAVVHAKPDGYTVGMGAQGPLAMLPHYGGIDYTVDDVDYLALMGRNLMVIAVGKDAPFQDAASFLAYAKAHSGEVSIGNSGAGGANHIAVEGMATAAGIKVKSMPFGGSSAAVTACVGGHINAVVASPAEVISQIKAGNLKAILIMEENRVDVLPDTPTTKEAGIDFVWSSWKGVIAPKGLPGDVRAKLAGALDKTFHDQQFLDKMKDLGEFVDYRPGDRYQALVKHDSAVAEQVIRSLDMYQMNVKK